MTSLKTIAHTFYMSEVAQEIGANLHSLLKKQLADEKKTLTDFPENHIFLGFQIVGYDDLRPRTIEVLLSRDVRCQVFDQLGCYASGSKEVVEAIWKLNETRRETNPIYEVFSLQEAIDYVDFLISSTIAFQRFSPMTPNVGGDIDIALVRPFDDIQLLRSDTGWRAAVSGRGYYPADNLRPVFPVQLERGYPLCLSLPSRRAGVRMRR